MGIEAQKVVSIELDEDVEMFDIEVPGYHNFIADGIVVHNCESGAGIIPRMGIGANVWQVIRIPTGEFGEVVAASFNTDIPAEFCVAVFDRPITANALMGYTPPVSDQSPTPVIANPDQDGFWATFPDDIGLIISWGGDGTGMAGYYPGRESDTDPITGVFKDNGSWNYWSTNPPWIWIAIYCTETTYIQGRFYPGLEGTGYRPSFTTLAEPSGILGG